MENEILKEDDYRQDNLLLAAVDIIIITISDRHLEVLLTKRSDPPFQGKYALPGSFIRKNETAEDAVKRCLIEEIGVKDIYTEQLYTWTALDRDPRSRVISVSYLALVNKSKCAPYANERVDDVKWQEISLSNIDELMDELSFDHGKIVKYALERLKGKIEYTDIIMHMTDDTFTLPQLQHIYEVILEKKLYKANFRNKMADKIEETGEFLNAGSQRPSKLYRWLDK